MNACNLFCTIFIFVCVLLSANAIECVYDDRGLCLSPCPADTISYSPACGSDTLSQRTCRQPVARSIGEYCDYSRCDCPEPKVLDEAAEKCVLIQDCSDQSKVKDGDRI